MKQTVWMLLLLSCAMAATVTAQPTDPTSETDARLARVLERFPEADTDGDGVLTRNEFVAFRELRGAPPRREDRPTTPGRRAQRRDPASTERRSRIERMRERLETDARRFPPTEADVAYGDHPRQVLDFWRAEDDGPTPVLIYFHGGGFVGGDKRLFPLQQRALPRGISAVSANYRFADGEDITIREIMADGARVIQFVRARAEAWGLDPERVVLTGGSAGGNMSIWLALHDDMAEPTSPDPVARQSTKPHCVVAYGAQTTNDARTILNEIGGPTEIHPSVPKIYGVDGLADLRTPHYEAMMERYSALNHASADDPPIYMVYLLAPPDAPHPPTTPVPVSIHSARFGLLLRDKLEPLGVETRLVWPGHNDKDPDELDWLLEQLR